MIIGRSFETILFAKSKIRHWKYNA